MWWSMNQVAVKPAVVFKAIPDYCLPSTQVPNMRWKAWSVRPCFVWGLSWLWKAIEIDNVKLVWELVI